MAVDQAVQHLRDLVAASCEVDVVPELPAAADKSAVAVLPLSLTRAGRYDRGGPVLDLRLRVLVIPVGPNSLETLEQRLQLVRQGCDEMQGFLLAHPVPASELPPLLAKLKTAAAGAGLGSSPG